MNKPDDSVINEAVILSLSRNLRGHGNLNTPEVDELHEDGFIKHVLSERRVDKNETVWLANICGKLLNGQSKPSKMTLAAYRAWITMFKKQGNTEKVRVIQDVLFEVDRL